MRHSYLSNKVEKRDSSTHGIGLFAVSAIPKGEIVAVKGGYIMTREEWADLEPSVGEAAEIHISDELVMAPSKKEEFEGCMMGINHSCEPNVGVSGQITYVTMRDVQAGEQLCLDYAMIDDYDGEMQCNCGTPSCRGKIHGKDWQIKDLQIKYKGYFSTFLVIKIKNK